MEGKKWNARKCIREKEICIIWPFTLCEYEADDEKGNNKKKKKKTEWNTI